MLLSDMYGTLVTSKDMMKGKHSVCMCTHSHTHTHTHINIHTIFLLGFDVLLDEVEDLKLDTPDAEEVLSV